MHFVMGATANVGSAVAETRLALGEPVGIITHDPGHVDSCRDTKAELIDADVNDVSSLRTRLPTFSRTSPAPPNNALAQCARYHCAGARRVNR